MKTFDFAVQWLAFLFHIQEVPCSNIGSETGSPDCCPQWLSSPTPYCKFRGNYLKLGHNQFVPHILQYIVHPMTWRYIFWVSLNVFK